jgi:hypothetical protein
MPPEFSGIPTFETQTSFDIPLAALFAFGAVAFITVVFFLYRGFRQNRHRRAGTFERVVLRIAVPKERRSEGGTSQASQEDRLEQVREEIALTETFFGSVAGLKAERGFKAWFDGRSDHLSCEMVVHDGLISFYIETPKRLRSMLEQQIHAQYPYAEIEEMIDYNTFGPRSSVVGAYITTDGPRVSPLKSYRKIESDPLASLLNVLSKMHEPGASLAVQYVLRSAKKSWRKQGIVLIDQIKKGKKEHHGIVGNMGSGVATFGSAIVKNVTGDSSKKNKDGGGDKKYEPTAADQEFMKNVQEKLGKGGLDVTIRLLSVANTSESAKMNLDNLVSGFSQYNLYQYGNSLKAVVPRSQTPLIRDFIYRAFNEKRSFVANTEEMASMWHLPLHSTEAPNIRWLGARRAPPPSNVPTEGLLLGHVNYRGLDTDIHMNDADRRRHYYVIGKSGSGKSVLLANLAIQDIKNGHGVCIIDPHGDLVEDVLQHIPKERAEDVIVFNPSDIDRPIGLNMLEAKTDDQKDYAVGEMIAIFYKLFPPEMIGPMFEHNMRNVMLTLMADVDNPGTIIDIPRMFTDDAYVKKYLVKLKDPVVRSFWEKEMAKTSDFHKSEMRGYLISKVGRFVENEMMRNIMGQQKSGFNFRDVMDKKKILLVNLAKGTTGEINAKLIGLIIVAKLQMAAMSRADLPQEQRSDFYLYIDEFQNFVTDSISTILSEARKYRLNLIIAHQYMGQLIDEKGRDDIRKAVLGNAGTMSAFRVGPEDTEILSKEFAPTFGPYDLLNVPQFSCYTKLLIDNTASKPFNMQTYPFQTGNKKLADAIKQLSRLTYGRDRRLVEEEILERTQIGVAETKAKTDIVESSL